jgi:hypothetical protein
VVAASHLHRGPAWPGPELPGGAPILLAQSTAASCALTLLRLRLPPCCLLPCLLPRLILAPQRTPIRWRSPPSARTYCAPPTRSRVTSRAPTEGCNTTGPPQGLHYCTAGPVLVMMASRGACAPPTLGCHTLSLLRLPLSDVSTWRPVSPPSCALPFILS